MSPRTWLSVLGVSVLVILGSFIGPALTQETKGKSHALLIGVKDYTRATLGALRYTENDVEQLAKVIDRAGSPFHGNVRLLTCSRGKKDKGDAPTAANIQKALKELIKNKGGKDTVLVALAGHGIQLNVPAPKAKAKAKEKSFAYFCPQDADLAGVDYKTGRHAHLVLLADLLGDLGDCGAGTKLLLMDACRNERTARSLRLNKELVPDGVAALFSCKSGQFAFETSKLGEGHGVFFYHVIEGLKGEAKDNRGRVTWSRLVDHTTEKVSEDVPALIGGGAKQTPHQIANIAGSSPVLVSGLKSEDSADRDKRAKGDRDKEGKEEVAKGPLKKDGTNSIGIKFVRIKKGTFLMGSGKDDKYEGGGWDDEKPRHKVTLTQDFYLGVYEVTQKQYRTLMRTNPSFCSKDGRADLVKGLDTDDFPVERVSWEDAQTFLNELNEREEKALGKWKYSLPTEAQWEYACRAGAATPKNFHFGPNLSRDDANFGGHGNALRRTTKVGSYAANAFGLHDMHGNVWEWCADWLEKYPDGDATDPSGPPKGKIRVTRGGGWELGDWSCRSAIRRGANPRYREKDLGFRVALVPVR